MNNKTTKELINSIVDKLDKLPEMGTVDCFISYETWFANYIDFSNHNQGDIMIQEKPPIGIKPRKFVEEERLSDLANVISRYAEKKLAIPCAWIQEYNELVMKQFSEIE